MKLTRISVDNFLGVHSIDVKLTTPITLFAGANGAAKSSIREAVAMAMTGAVERVNLKKEYDQLVTDGAKQGGALISVGEDSYAFNVPEGKFKADDNLPTGESVAIALNGQHFASMPADARRTFLFGLTGCKISRDDVRERMVKRNCDVKKIDATLPMLRTGFPDACEFAKKKATESKGAWRAITNATYGSKVAESWKAEKPAAPAGDVATSKQALVALETEIADLNQKQGEMNAAAKVRAESAAKRLTLQSAAESYPRVNENLERAKLELAEYEPKVIALRERAAGTARVGLIHDMGRFIKMDVQESRSEKERLDLVNRYEAEHGKIDPTATPDLDAQSSLPEHERGLEVLRNSVTNLQRDLNNAQIAKVAFDALAPADVAVDTAGDLAALQTRLAALKSSRDKMQADIRAIEDVLRKIAEADEKTKKAAEHHADVAAWGVVADALAPDGIPDELLTEALKPVNTRLMASAIQTTWAVPRIEPDMQITAGNRAYALLSESEKWRVDAMIAEAVAFISGLKILMLDRVDVLDLPGRSTLLGWLHLLAQETEVETVLLFATLKALPAAMYDTMAGHWIAGGSIQQLQAVA